MKYLIILLSLLLFGCNRLSEDAKELQNSSLCLDGNRYLIIDCYDTLDPDHCYVMLVKHPEMRVLLSTDQIKVLLTHSARECPE